MSHHKKRNLTKDMRDLLRRAKNQKRHPTTWGWGMPSKPPRKPFRIVRVFGVVGEELRILNNKEYKQLRKMKPKHSFKILGTFRTREECSTVLGALKLF